MGYREELLNIYRYLDLFYSTSPMFRYLVLLGTDGAQVGLVAAAADVAQLFDDLGRHGLGETQSTPGVSGCPDLGDHRLPLHG